MVSTCCMSAMPLWARGQVRACVCAHTTQAHSLPPDHVLLVQHPTGSGVPLVAVHAPQHQRPAVVRQGAPHHLRVAEANLQEA